MPAMNSGEESPNTMRESGFRANLHGASLADLVQMECLSGHERVIRISSGTDVGYLFFRGGQIVHAVSRRGIGETAALEILRWNDGTFEPCSAGKFCRLARPRFNRFQLAEFAAARRSTPRRSQSAKRSQRSQLGSFSRSALERAAPLAAAAAFGRTGTNVYVI